MGVVYWVFKAIEVVFYVVVIIYILRGWKK